MKAKSLPAGAPAHPPLNSFDQASLRHASAAAECATAMFRGFEEIRKVQESAAHAAAQRHATVAARLKGGCSPEDMMAMQAELLKFDVDGATRYWQDLGAAALEMQTRMLACCNQFVQSDVMLEAASAFDRMTGPGTVSARA